MAVSLAAALVRGLAAARRIDASNKPIGLAALFGAAALALHGATDSILHFPALLFSLAVLLGIAAGLTAPSRGAHPRIGTALLAAGLCAATLTLGGVFQPWNVPSQFGAARRNQLDGNAAAARQGYRAALQANPHSAAPWLGLAELARLQGDDAQALRYVRTARTVEPFTYRVEWALADLELATGDVPGGVETLRMVCDQLPDLRPAAYLLAYRAGAPLTLIEDRLTAPEPYAVGEYLAFLIRSGNQDQVAAAQHRLVEIQGVTLSEAHRRFISNAFQADSSR